MDERTEERDTEGMLGVRATIHLPGLKLGAEALVDPSDPYIALCLEANYLVPLDGEG